MIYMGAKPTRKWLVTEIGKEEIYCSECRHVVDEETPCCPYCGSRNAPSGVKFIEIHSR